MIVPALIAGGVFTDAEDFEVIDLGYVPPIPGATHDWAANRLPLGPLPKWESVIDGKLMSVAGGTPTVTGTGKNKAVVFDGVDDRMQCAFTLTGAHTMVTVYRFVAPADGNQIHYDLSGVGVGAIGIGGSGTAVRAAGGSKFILPSPAIAPDTAWHVAVLTIDGANSGLRIDGRETPGTLDLGTRNGITLGFSGPGNLRTAIEYKRQALIPGPMTAAARASLVDQLTTYHNA